MGTADEEGGKQGEGIDVWTIGTKRIRGWFVVVVVVIAAVVVVAAAAPRDFMSFVCLLVFVFF